MTPHEKICTNFQHFNTPHTIHMTPEEYKELLALRQKAVEFERESEMTAQNVANLMRRIQTLETSNSRISLDGLENSVKNLETENSRLWKFLIIVGGLAAFLIYKK